MHNVPAVASNDMWMPAFHSPAFSLNGMSFGRRDATHTIDATQQQQKDAARLGKCDPDLAAALPLHPLFPVTLAANKPGWDPLAFLCQNVKLRFGARTSILNDKFGAPCVCCSSIA
jgi:hypothetical protein